VTFPYMHTTHHSLTHPFHYSSSFPSPCIGYFWDRVLLYVLASLDCHPHICASLRSWNEKCEPL
jgi:hypothetical protein